MIRHYIACDDCDLVMSIRVGSYQYCYKCGGHKISIFTLKGTKEELDNVDGMKYSDVEKRRKE